MKTFELLNEEGTWKEIVSYQFTPEQIAFMNAPITEENRTARAELLAEVQAASKLEVDEETTAKLNAEYELQKAKLPQLSSDFQLIWANFRMLEDGGLLGTFHYKGNDSFHVHDFFPAAPAVVEETPAAGE
jgi:hypothetical protein